MTAFWRMPATELAALVRSRQASAVEVARDALAPMKAGVHKDALVEVLEFCISRAN